MKSHMKYWHRLLPIVISVLLVGCTGIGTTSPEFSTQNAARTQAQLTGPFTIVGFSRDQETDIWIGANLSPEKGNRSTATGTKLIFLVNQSPGMVLGDFCVNHVAGFEVKQTGKKISFVLSFQDGSALNGKGTVAADGSISGSYTNVGPCQWTGGPGTFTAGKVAPLAGTYTGGVTDFDPVGDTITIALDEAADGSLKVTGTSQLAGAFVMTGFVAGDLFFMEGTVNGLDIPIYGIPYPAIGGLPTMITLVGPNGNIEGWVGTLFAQ